VLPSDSVSSKLSRDDEGRAEGGNERAASFVATGGAIARIGGVATCRFGGRVDPGSAGTVGPRVKPISTAIGK